MSKITYYWKMSPEELMRLARSESLKIPSEKLHEVLCRVWDDGRDAAMYAAYEDKGEVKFDPMP